LLPSQFELMVNSLSVVSLARRGIAHVVVAYTTLVAVREGDRESARFMTPPARVALN